MVGLIAGGAYAQTLDGKKFAYLDLSQVFDNYAKTKEYEKNKDDNFKKAVSYLEKSYEVTKDKQTKTVLRQLWLRLGDTAKADTYK